jgi:lysozyme
VNIDLAIGLCKEFEGFRSAPYLCPAGVSTIGYGSTRYANGRRVTLKDERMTEAGALALLKHELQNTYLLPLLKLSPVLTTNERQANAILDFVYNLGISKYESSTLRKMVDAANWQGAAKEIIKWNKGGGKILPGLVRRREAEAKLLV